MPFDLQGYAQDTAATETATNTEGHPVWLYVGLFLLLGLWGISVAIFGLPGLYMPAVIATPVMFGIILRITTG